MKITNKQIRQIIKEELEVVLSEASPLIYGMGVDAAAKKQRAAAKKREDDKREREAQARQRTRDSINKRLTPKPTTSSAAALAPSAPTYLRTKPAGDASEGLEALRRAKNAAIQTLGVDADGDLPYMYAFGGMGQQAEEMLKTYYDGDMDFYEAIAAAIDAGELGENSIDDESGGFNLSELFPGK